MRRIALFVAILLAGCGLGEERRKAQDESEVRAAFDLVREAIMATNRGDAVPIWEIISTDSRARADEKARAIRQDYAKADADEQAILLQRYQHVTPEELARLSGAGYLKTGKFYALYWQATAAEADQVDIQGDKATVYYRDSELDQDRKRMAFVREEDGWKAELSIP